MEAESHAQGNAKRGDRFFRTSWTRTKYRIAWTSRSSPVTRHNANIRAGSSALRAAL